MPAYQFTNQWFNGSARPLWEDWLPRIKPQRILEIGAYEGASACWLIEHLGVQQSLELHCIDTWQGGIEHQPGGTAAADMSAVEQRFHHNLKIALQGLNDLPHKTAVHVHKTSSVEGMARLLASGQRGSFDFIYIDGSHQAPDVLADAVLAFHLLRVGGVLAFDDYLWAEDLPGGPDPLRCPKPAIDAFVNLHFRKLRVLVTGLQLLAQKVSE